MVSPKSPADPFAGSAASYDAGFSSLPRVVALRRSIYDLLGSLCRSGGEVLEVGCGSGDDALMLTGRGYHLLATDPSEAMLAVARRKAVAAGIEIDFRQLHAEEIGSLAPRRFDAVFSNFGPLNCVERLEPVFESMASLLPPGGIALIVLLNRTSLWETAVGIFRANPRKAFRRWTSDPVPVPLPVGDCLTWYHSFGSISHAAEKHFNVATVRGLWIFSPPPASQSFSRNHPHIVKILDVLDAHVSRWRPFRLLGDHLLVVCRKRTQVEHGD
jgi:SAM-dependent methyltransferase